MAHTLTPVQLSGDTLQDPMPAHTSSLCTFELYFLAKSYNTVPIYMYNSLVTYIYVGIFFVFVLGPFRHIGSLKKDRIQPNPHQHWPVHTSDNMIHSAKLEALVPMGWGCWKDESS